MDDADRAQGLEETFRDSALAARQRRPVETPHWVGGTRVCLECDEEIDPDRVTANPQAVRCLDCQVLHERITGA